jgi:hypothetical protein
MLNFLKNNRVILIGNAICALIGVGIGFNLTLGLPISWIMMILGFIAAFLLFNFLDYCIGKFK